MTNLRFPRVSERSRGVDRPSAYGERTLAYAHARHRLSPGVCSPLPFAPVLPPGQTAPASPPDDRVDRAAHALPPARAAAVRRAVHDPDGVVGRADGAHERPGGDQARVRGAARRAPGRRRRGLPRAVRGPQLDPGPARRRAPQATPPRAAALPRPGAQRWTTTIQRLAHEHLDTWPVSTPFKALPRMQELTLEIIQRVIFGSKDPELEAALRSALDLTQSTPNLIAMSLVQKRHRPVRPLPQSHRSASTSSSTSASTSPAAATRSSTCSGTPERREASSATSSSRSSPPATRPRRPRWRGRSNGSRVIPRTSPTEPDPFIARGPAHPPGAQHHRPQDPAAVPARPTTRCRKASTSRPASTWPIAAAGRSRGAAARAAASGAAFAQLELREVLRAVSSRFTLRPTRAEGERMRRRSITLAPSRGAEIIADPLA